MKNKEGNNIEGSTIETETSEYQGEIMSVATKDVISIAKTTPIIKASELMVKNKIRRLPIVDSGSKKILGIITSMDILDFLGGGEKFKIMEKRYGGNFLSAINKPVKEIMTSNVTCVTPKSTIKDSISKMIANNVGALPIVDNDNKLVGIITEQDFVTLLSGLITNELVEDIMTTDVITSTPGTPIESVSKIMVRNSLRRLPIVGADETSQKPKLMGIMTSTDILRYLGESEIFSKLESTNALEALSGAAEEIMSTDLMTTEPKVRVGAACAEMTEKGIGGLPVVKNDEVIGIITERDVLRIVAP